MPSEPAESDIVRWRLWPCEECTRGTTVFDFILGRHAASEEISAGSEDEVVAILARRERGWLGDYVALCSHTKWETAPLRRLDEGSEHIVYLAPDDQWVLKVTKLGLYGDYYFVSEGRVYQRAQTPLEYLLRHEFVRRTFGIAPEALAITDAGQFFSRQQFVQGDPPSQEEVDDFLLSAGIEPVKQNCWLWRKVDPDKKLDYWIGDARADNFVKTSNGLVPIDLRMWGVIPAITE